MPSTRTTRMPTAQHSSTGKRLARSRPFLCPWPVLWLSSRPAPPIILRSEPRTLTAALGPSVSLSVPTSSVPTLAELVTHSDLFCLNLISFVFTFNLCSCSYCYSDVILVKFFVSSVWQPDLKFNKRFLLRCLWFYLLCRAFLYHLLPSFLFIDKMHT